MNTKLQLMYEFYIFRKMIPAVEFSESFHPFPKYSSANVLQNA